MLKDLSSLGMTGDVLEMLVGSIAYRGEGDVMVPVFYLCVFGVCCVP